MNKEERTKFLEDLKRSPSTHKRRKLSEGDDFKVSEFYIKNSKDDNAENMWGKDEKFNLEDLNLNLLPDDEHSLLKQKSEMKWDKTKKKYVQVVVGKDGTKSKLKNESGKFINYKKDKDPELYKKWMKRTHLKIQETGEREDRRTVESAGSFHKNRRELKRMGKKATNIKGKDKEQLRRMEQIEKLKKKKQKMKDYKKGNKRDPNSASSIAFNRKIQGKIEARSRPTKTKIILKERKHKRR